MRTPGLVILLVEKAGGRAVDTVPASTIIEAVDQNH